MRHRFIPLLVLLIGVGGCASAPVAETHVGGPLRAVSFRLSGPADVPPSPVAAEVRDELVRRGLSPSAGDRPADYVVEVAYADRPRAVAAASPAGVVAPRVARGARTLFT